MPGAAHDVSQFRPCNEDCTGHGDDDVGDASIEFVSRSFVVPLEFVALLEFVVPLEFVALLEFVSLT